MHIYLNRLHVGNILNYFLKECVKRIKLIYGVLEPGTVLKPGTPPRTRTSVSVLLTFMQKAYVVPLVFKIAGSYTQNIKRLFYYLPIVRKPKVKHTAMVWFINSFCCAVP